MLAVIGDVVQDVVVRLRERIRYASDTACDIVIQRGGSAANVAAFAAPRVPTRFIGCVGDDLAGPALIRELEGHGVEVLAQVRGSTGTIVVQVDPSGERSMFPSRGACGMLSRIDPRWLAGVELLHLTAYSFETETARAAVIEAAARVHANGGRVSLDASSAGTIQALGQGYVQAVLEVRPDFLSANAEEAALLSLVDDDAPGPLLTRLEGTTVLARRGARPTRVVSADGLVCEVAVRPVEFIKDLTGAGDAFNAGFLASALRDGGAVGRECDAGGLERHVRAGHDLARRVLARPGASLPPE